MVENSESQKVYMQAVEYEQQGNQEKAFKCLTEAADLGNKNAQCALGYYYCNGIFIDKNYEKAIKLYTLSAKQGVVEAICNLAYMFDKGIGVQRDIEKTTILLRLAAQKGHIGAQYDLGCILINNDINEALKWLISAASSNNSEASFNAQYKLGLYYEVVSQHGIRVDLGFESAKWYKLAASNGHEEAKKALEIIG